MEKALSLRELGLSIGDEVKRSLSTASRGSLMVCWVDSGSESAVKRSKVMLESRGSLVRKISD